MMLKQITGKPLCVIYPIHQFDKIVIGIKVYVANKIFQIPPHKTSLISQVLEVCGHAQETDQQVTFCYKAQKDTNALLGILDV